MAPAVAEASRAHGGLLEEGDGEPPLQPRGARWMRPSSRERRLDPCDEQVASDPAQSRHRELTRCCPTRGAGPSDDEGGTEPPLVAQARALKRQAKDEPKAKARPPAPASAPAPAQAPELEEGEPSTPSGEAARASAASVVKPSSRKKQKARTREK